MSVQHKKLAEGKWSEMPFLIKMANIGSEVERAVKWREKENRDYSMKAFGRALELINLTLNTAEKFPRLKEVARVKEALLDFFCGYNTYGTSGEMWRSYFYKFTYAARKDC